MLGALAGDIAGSIYEFRNARQPDFPLYTSQSFFTDDSVLTIATADVLLHGGSYASVYKTYGRKFPHAGYGGRFRNWLKSADDSPYNSYGNGSAMRVSPVGFGFNTLEEVLAEAERSAAVTHNHPEGIRGAQATALAIFIARHGASKADIRREITERFGYNLERSIEEIRPTYHFDETCQGTVPEAVIAFLESTDFEDALRRAIWLGGDSDTLACITGAIAQAFYGSVPGSIQTSVRSRLPQEFLQVLDEFEDRFMKPLHSLQG